jgi:hypothetical protein
MKGTGIGAGSLLAPEEERQTSGAHAVWYPER